MVYQMAILLQLESLAFTLWDQRISNCSPHEPSVHTVNPGASAGQGGVRNKRPETDGHKQPSEVLSSYKLI